MMHVAAFEVDAPHSGRPTSAAAAHSATPRAGSQRARVYDFIAGCAEYGATDDEIMAALNMRGSSEHPRRWELVNAGLVIPDPTGRTRPTIYGKEAIVWLAAEIK